MRIVDFAPVRCLSAYIRQKLKSGSATYRIADLYAPGVDDKVDLMENQNGEYFGILMSNGVGMAMSVKSEDD